jgi:hypothetical protein
MPTMIAPHQFQPLSRWRHKKKCKRCYQSKEEHNSSRWVVARPLKDKREHP